MLASFVVMCEVQPSVLLQLDTTSHAPQRRALHSLVPQDSSMLAWALGRLQLQPQPQWLQAFLHATTHMLPTCTPQVG